MTTFSSFVFTSLICVLTCTSPRIRASAADVPAMAGRQAYFGDLHLHTSYSLDAYLEFGAQVDPEGAYRFARGEPGKYLGEPVNRTTLPLDFIAVTDHAEWIGVVNTLDDPDSTLSRSDVGRKIREKPFEGRKLAGGWPQKVATQTDVDTGSIASSAWQRTISAANRYYQPGRFTTFIAYEWTAMPGSSHLHRNVIFRNDSAPPPFTALDSDKPEDLWAYLDRIHEQGYQALAIPHSSNLSNGLTFDWVDSERRRIDQTYAEQRASHEPLVEIVQNKGQSETHPLLSPNDELSNFEIFEIAGPAASDKNKAGGSYVRSALGRGLEIMHQAGGVNPFKYGFVGGSDFHNGLSESGERAYGGLLGAIDPTRKLPGMDEWLRRLGRSGEARSAMIDESSPALTGVFAKTSSAGLTGVWAEQNTRESIYAALRRKETFATSGTRLRFRIFGGWDLPNDLFKQKDWVTVAYHAGVPMGGDLPIRLRDKAALKLALWAVKDPNGANLDRLQIVKIWLENGKLTEKVFDVAASGGRLHDSPTERLTPVGNTVDLRKATYTNTIGAVELSTIWIDREFDAKAPAAYYLRVLEIPTPRWSTVMAVRRGVAPPDNVPPTIQERGWSSPIWYTPP